MYSLSDNSDEWCFLKQYIAGFLQLGYLSHHGHKHTRNIGLEIKDGYNNSPEMQFRALPDV